MYIHTQGKLNLFTVLTKTGKRQIRNVFLPCHRKDEVARCQWLRPVILATWEAKIGKDHGQKPVQAKKIASHHLNQ
jgi:hypothetical protein